MIVKTFKIRDDEQNIESAIAQCIYALADLGCSSSVTRYKKSIRVTSNEPILNTERGEYIKPSFKLELVPDFVRR